MISEKINIQTIQDIVENIKPEDLDAFLIDLKGVVLGCQLVRLKDENATLINGFDWINDGNKSTQISIIHSNQSTEFQLSPKNKQYGKQ